MNILLKNLKEKPIIGFNHIKTPFGADGIYCPFCTRCILDRNISSEIINNLLGTDEGCSVDYCFDCKIIFSICCVYEEWRCTDSIYWPSFLVINWTENNETKEIKNPVITLKEYVELKKNKDITLKMICQCPGMCTQGPKGYTEYVGLGLNCCKPLDSETRLKNEEIFNQREEEFEEKRRKQYHNKKIFS